MMFDRGDLLLVPFPFSDLSATKRRPVVVLTCPDAYGDFIALPITSRRQQEHGFPLLLADLVQGTLPRVSWVRTDRVVTLSAGLVIKNFGRMFENILTTAVMRLCVTVGQ